MLDKKDLTEIKGIIKDAFAEFYETVFLPFAERNEKEHQEFRVEMREIRTEMRDMRGELVDYIKDHETRIRKVEKAVVTS